MGECVCSLAPISRNLWFKRLSPSPVLFFRSMMPNSASVLTSEDYGKHKKGCDLLQQNLNLISLSLSLCPFMTDITCTTDVSLLPLPSLWSSWWSNCYVRQWHGNPLAKSFGTRSTTCSKKLLWNSRFINSNWRNVNNSNSSRNLSQVHRYHQRTKKWQGPRITHLSHRIMKYLA